MRPTLSVTLPLHRRQRRRRRQLSLRARGMGLVGLDLRRIVHFGGGSCCAGCRVTEEVWMGRICGTYLLDLGTPIRPKCSTVMMYIMNTCVCSAAQHMSHMSQPPFAFLLCGDGRRQPHGTALYCKCRVSEYLPLPPHQMWDICVFVLFLLPSFTTPWAMMPGWRWRRRRPLQRPSLT